MFENINEGLLDFLEKSPTAFHAVSNIRAALQASGYTELSEAQKWGLRRGGRYFTVRNESSVIAFRIPQEDYTHFMIAAAHSDSPSFKIKANPEVKAGPYVKLNVEKYGGMLIAPWFDRPLSVAGRLIVQDENGGLTTRLVNVDRDLLMLPSLAIHMDREANSGHAFNVQNEVMPLFGDETSAGHFMEIVAQAAGVKKEAILGDDLFLYARGRGTVFG
ncbi:MAG TPA: M18 family aminopeptidase, partial [Lachnospiraceae bacterium]|nr:M18 family aminopeptidase [Lachnospiraceae bacterium]